MDKVLGYDYKNGELVVNEQEMRIVQNMIKKYVAYADHPPEELVLNYMKYYKEATGENLPYETAQKQVPLDQIIQYIMKELDDDFTPEMIEKMKYSRVKYPRAGSEKDAKDFCAEVNWEPILSKEQYEQIQRMIQQRQTEKIGNIKMS